MRIRQLFFLLRHIYQRTLEMSGWYPPEGRQIPPAKMVKPIRLFRLDQVFLMAGGILVLIGASTAAYADIQVSTDVTPKKGTVDDSFTLDVRFSGEAARLLTQPEFEDSKAFDLGRTSSSVSHSFVNGQQQSKVQYSFEFIPTPKLKPGKYALPQGTILVNGKETKLKQPYVTITKSDSAKSSRTAVGISFVQMVDIENPYVGQQILYKAQITSDKKIFRANINDGEFPGFWKESYNKRNEAITSIGNDRMTIHTIQEALFPTEAGIKTIGQRRITLSIRGDQGYNQRKDYWGGLLSFDIHTRARMKKKRVVAGPINVHVRPLPSPPTPITTPILVGNVKLASSIDRTDIKQGESVNMRVELYGNANLRAFELPTLSPTDEQNYKAYYDKPVLQVFHEKDRVRFVKKFAIALVPLKTGTLDAPNYTIHIFVSSKL